MNVSGKGKDDFAVFAWEAPGRCETCDESVEIVVRYLRNPLKKYEIQQKSTILKRPWRIGVTCGCYAKFHRQVAHIADKQSQRHETKSRG